MQAASRKLKLILQTDVLFCPICGTLLSYTDTSFITCECCQFSCRYDDFEHQTIVTKSLPKAIPKWLKSQDKAESVELKREVALVEEECPKCGNPKLSFYTMQLRSADEGSTVFYECPKCRYKFNLNN